MKNGAELLDRLLKDIVAETASVYIPHYPETEKVQKAADDASDGNILVPHPDDVASGADINGARKAFSLARFIPLLSERIYVLSPFTRSYLVSWITVLDSVPELELITYLPEFLDGLLYVNLYFTAATAFTPCLQEVPIRPHGRCTSSDREPASRLPSRDSRCDGGTKEA